jgi:hypothetical protein
VLPWARRHAFRAAVTALALGFAICCCFYPAMATVRVAFDPEVRRSGQPSALPEQFERTALRYDRWATAYLASGRAAGVHPDDVAATEWPIFGSVFFVLTAEELIKSGKVARSPELDRALGRAAEVIASPTTASWVRRKWGEGYLLRENVFYRTLLILGLSSYEQIRGDPQYHTLSVGQAERLGSELARAPHHLGDDYPGECYSSDVLWAVAAVQRVRKREGKPEDGLTRGLLEVLDGPVRTEQGLPAFRVDSRTARPMQPARGCGNSGLLPFAAELDPELAMRWYDAYVESYWVGEGLFRGFREMPHGATGYSDVDSGPVLFGIGTVASGLGIGAARSVGRYDHAAPLTMEAVAVAWPTPFGFLFPGILGSLAADGWCFGELALDFSMTRPNSTTRYVPYSGPVPPVVWLLVGLYLLAGAAIVGWEARCWRKRLRAVD